MFSSPCRRTGSCPARRTVTTASCSAEGSPTGTPQGLCRCRRPRPRTQRSGARASTCPTGRLSERRHLPRLDGELRRGDLLARGRSAPPSARCACRAAARQSIGADRRRGAALSGFPRRGWLLLHHRADLPGESMKLMAAYSGGRWTATARRPSRAWPARNVPCRMNRHPTGSTVTSVAGQMAELEDYGRSARGASGRR